MALMSVIRRWHFREHRLQIRRQVADREYSDENRGDDGPDVIVLPPHLLGSTKRVSKKNSNSEPMPVQDHMSASVSPIGSGGAPTMYGADLLTCADALAGRKRKITVRSAARLRLSNMTISFVEHVRQSRLLAVVQGSGRKQVV